MEQPAQRVMLVSTGIAAVFIVGYSVVNEIRIRQVQQEVQMVQQANNVLNNVLNQTIINRVFSAAIGTTTPMWNAIVSDLLQRNLIANPNVNQ